MYIYIKKDFDLRFGIAVLRQVDDLHKKNVWFLCLKIAVCVLHLILFIILNKLSRFIFL